MHSGFTRTFLPLLLAFASVCAVPSSTHHIDPAINRHDRHSPLEAPLVDRYPSIWKAARKSVTDVVCDYFYRAEGTQASLLHDPLPKPAHQYLALYDNQVVLRFSVTTLEESQSLTEAADILFLDVWNTGSDGVDIRLATDVLPSLLGLLPDSLQHAHKPLMQGHELAQAILDTLPFSHFSQPSNAALRRRIAPAADAHDVDTNIFFADYQSYRAMSHWILLMQALFRSHVRLVTVGHTYEGRNITAIRVGAQHDDIGSPRRKTIIVSGGTHAREWVSISTVNYVAYSLITRYGNERKITKLLDEVDFLFIPTLNPDGYIHSYEVDRLWRKSRQPTSLSFCPGIDLDRSWPYQWDGQRTIDNPCSESFAGTHAFESIEASSFATWAKNETEHGGMDFVGLLDLHSYSQEILYPYSYSCDNEPPTVEDLEEMGYGLQRAIASHGRTNYKVMQACEGNVAANGKVLPKMEGGGGSALDWFYAELGVKKAFQIKLRDNGVYGFLLPKEYIVPTGVEILSAVEYFGTELAKSFVLGAADGNRPTNIIQSDAATGLTTNDLLFDDL